MPEAGIGVTLREIEKSIGTSADSTGVSQSMLGYMLSWMQDKSASGCILIGPPGAAKSMIAKAFGNSFGIPTIAFDLSGMKASLVGESEARLRTALRVVDAVSQGRAIVIATCNSITNLPPELRRRFTFGTFFFDLPTAEERNKIWAIYRTAFKLPASDALPEDEGWTGAEIRQACQLAWRLKINLRKAATFIVPIAVSAGDKVEALRREASGRFISASNPGLYEFRERSVSVSARMMDMAGDSDDVPSSPDAPELN